MRHRVHSSRLGRKPHQSRMIARNLATSLLLYEKVRTTKRRAEVVRPIVDRLIVTAKKNRPDLAIRRINEIVTDKNACRKLIDILAKRYADRSSGFSRAVPAGMRGGDGALLVDIELLEGKVVIPPKDSKESREAKDAKDKKKKKSSASSASLASSASS